MMDLNSGQIDRRAYLKTTGLATAGMVGLAGCTSDGTDGDETDDTDDTGDDDAFGTLSTAITDQPNDIGDFDELLVTIDGIWVLPAAVDDEDAEDAEEQKAMMTNKSTTPKTVTTARTQTERKTATKRTKTATPRMPRSKPTARVDATSSSTIHRRLIWSTSRATTPS